MSSADGSDRLWERLAVIEDRVRTCVARRRAADPAPDDPFRGLYLSDAHVDRLLENPWPPPGAGRSTEDGGRPTFTGPPEGAGSPHLPAPVRRLVAAGLDGLDLDLLLVAVLPDLDPRFERLYGYLNDDVTRRRASVALALELVGASPLWAQARRRLAPDGLLARLGLVVVEESERPFLSRPVRVPDRVVGHLLGDHDLDPSLVDLVADAEPHPGPVADALARAFTEGTRLVHVRDGEAATAVATAVAALDRYGCAALVLDLDRLATSADPDELVLAVVRESVLTGGGVVAGPVEALAPRTATLRRLVSGPAVVALVGHGVWDPRWTDHPPVTVDAPVLSPEESAELWRRHLAPANGLGGVDGDTAGALEGVTAHLALGPGQVASAVRAARAHSLLAGGPVSRQDLRRGVQSQNAAGLGRLARRVEPDVAWPDLILAPPVARALHEVCDRARYRHTVLSQWRMRPGGGRGHGVTALFAGDSGTGKTMSAEVIAGDLGLDLYTVNLATVVDKYIGETEKNLERIFSEAAGVSAVLFFDEADAIFGKRGDVRDAHDRYANIESAYLLQRLESFNGLAVLATNLRANIDEAFTRRLDAVVDFPAPGPELRRRLWKRCLDPPLPLADDVDLDFCAASFEMTGGNIRSACTTAAYLAAAGGRAVAMADLVTGVEQEYRKLGRLVLAGEFGDYLALFG